MRYSRGRGHRPLFEGLAFAKQCWIHFECFFLLFSSTKKNFLLREINNLQNLNNACSAVRGTGTYQGCDTEVVHFGTGSFNALSK